MNDHGLLNHTSWQTLGAVLPKNLVEARLQLHWAAQIVSAVGTTLVPPREDDSHTNFEWLDRISVLAGEPVQGRKKIRAAIAPATLTLHVLGEDARVLDSFSLDGRTYHEGIAWMGRAVEDGAELKLPRPLARRELALPAHPVAEGGRAKFTAHLRELTELSRWFANADSVGRALASGSEHTSPVRCWPHHFDHALLISLEPEKAFVGKTIGMGMEPGDENYDEPYWYVNPYPRPDPASLPELTSGSWHTQGWVGAILRGSEIVRAKTPQAQREFFGTYLSAALSACHRLLQ